jgi:hypothetical protein
VVVSAAHFKEVTNGYEQQTDGLWVHRGKMDVGTLRATNTLPPLRGAGTEIHYNPSAGVGSVFAYDRDADVYKDLNIAGRNITLSTIGGTLNLPDGSVQTADLAAGAATQYLGGYSAGANWTTPAVNTWYETPIQTTVTVSSVYQYIRIEAGAQFYGNTAGAYAHVGIGWNASIQYSLSTWHCVAVGYQQMANFVHYIGPAGVAPGSVRFAVFMYGAGGTFTLWNGSASYLYVNEQRR